MMKKLTMVALSATLLSSTALAQDVCEVSEPMDTQRFFRRLSLDLEGAAPTLDSIRRIQQAGEVDSTHVDAMLQSEDFLGVLRDYHRSLLWPNLDETPLVPDTHMLFPMPVDNGTDVIYLSPVRSVYMRTISGDLFVPCANEPARFDSAGRVIADAMMVGGSTVAWVEGYVEVEPYWAPGTTVKVCGFDAQPNVSADVCTGDAERYPYMDPICDQFREFASSVQAPFDGTSVDCNTRSAIVAPGCGCGPNLDYCQTDETASVIRLSLLEQQLRILDETIRRNRPYHEALITKEIDFNGPAVHYLDKQSRLNFDIEGAPDPTAPTPPLAYTQFDEWLRVTRTGRHSGVLTTPGYLLRFTTWRGRAHRYYNAFECSAFIPNGPLPSPQDPCSDHENLTLRCGCDACHQALDPMAAHWGRYSEYGYKHLDDENFPRNGIGRCTPPLANVDELIDCFRQYELDPVGEEEPYTGQLNAYVFRTPDEAEKVDIGPSALVQEALTSGRMSSCTVRKMWTHFMRREPTLEERADVLPNLMAGYEQSGHDIRTLVKQIVLHPAYRRQP